MEVMCWIFVWSSNNWRRSLLFSSRAHRAGTCFSMNNFTLILIFCYSINFSTILWHYQLVASENDNLCQFKPIFDISSKIRCNVISIKLKVCIFGIWCFSLGNTHEINWLTIVHIMVLTCFMHEFRWIPIQMKFMQKFRCRHFHLYVENLKFYLRTNSTSFYNICK